jgi:hypothetical protein
MKEELAEVLEELNLGLKVKLNTEDFIEMAFSSFSFGSE